MDVINILVNLLKIKSLYSQEDEIRRYIVDFLKSKGNIKVFRNNVVFFNNENYKVAFVGHIDTIDNVNEKNGVIEGDKVFGLGASDMKAGIAVMLALASELHHLPIVWIFYDREEGNYEDNGLEIVFQNMKIKDLEFAIIFEPTSNNIEIGCNGVINYGIWIRGKSGHSARKETYLNPFYLSIPLIQHFKGFQLNDYEKKIAIKSKEFILRYKNNAVITLVKGFMDYENENSFKNVVPEYCFINLNVRFTPNFDFEEIDGLYRKEIGSFSNIERIDILDRAPAGKVIINDALANFIDKFLSFGNFEIRAKQAWTDVARFSVHNIPAINLGPGLPEQAHQKNEYAQITKIQELYNIMKKIMDKGI